jgi:hypothetical protein
MSATITTDERRELIADFRQGYQDNLEYFESSGSTEVRGRKVESLGLPKSIVERYYKSNALQYYRGPTGNCASLTLA